jgi:phenylalanyl-tRNA synthetase alpha chain
VLEVIERKKIELTEEGKGYADYGTPEYQYASSLILNVVTAKAEVEAKVGDLIAKIGFAKAMKNKWVRLEADKVSVTRIAENLQDDEKVQLSAYVSNPDLEAHDKKVVDALKKRKLLNVNSSKSYKVTKGSEFQPLRVKLETQLTADMLRTGSWKETQFKKVNINSAGQVTQGGHLHPLLKVRSQFRQTLLEMGFNEMPTDRFVESSFWNFDALFQPQSHPARDMHDTFFLKNPVSCNYIPEDYCKIVKQTHEDGLEGSFGYGKGWSLEETKKNILRTHTTAVSSQMLYKLA